MRWLDWLSMCGTPVFWRRLHAVMALFWTVNIPLAVFTDLKTSIAYLIFVSLMTAVSGEMSALHGVTVQEKQEEQTTPEAGPTTPEVGPTTPEVGPTTPG